MYGRERRSGCGGAQLLIAVAIVGFSACSYFGTRQTNPVTGETQYVDLNPQQEIALGLQSAPAMARQHGGLDPDPRAQQLVDEVGNRIVERSDARKAPYKFEFHALRDPKTVNAFALPGGQIFITRALLGRLKTKGELAGVLGHEIAHVVGRHGAEHLAKQKLTQGLVAAGAVATTDPGDTRTYKNAALAAAIGQMVTMKYGRDDEIESDALGVRYMAQAGYDPRAMIRVMKVLAAAGGGGRTPEFFSTHPNPENRIGKIETAIKRTFVNGVPDGLER